MMRDRKLAKPENREISAMEPWNSFRDMERMFRNFFVSPFGGWMEPALWNTEGAISSPEVELKETEDHVVLSAALPGINKDDIDIDVTADSISVSGTRQSVEEKPGETVHIRRQQYGSYQFRYRLPAEIKPNDVTATYKDGILEITMPKAEVTQSTKVKIET